jgi:hypothetical protein
VLVVFFSVLVVVPMAIIGKLKDSGNFNSYYFFENGIDKKSPPKMIIPLFEILEKNMKKKIKLISDD